MYSIKLIKKIYFLFYFFHNSEVVTMMAFNHPPPQAWWKKKMLKLAKDTLELFVYVLTTVFGIFFFFFRCTLFYEPHNSSPFLLVL